MSNTKFWILTGMIIATAIFRLVPHPFNFTPVMAMSLFAGAKFADKKWSVIVPVSAMFISDLVLSYVNHYPLFHDTIFFVYGSVLLTIAMGWNLQSEKLNVGKTALFALLSSILFFVITNIAVWVFGGLYTSDAAGLTKCFIMAVPFFKISLLGDVFFVTVLFGAFEFIQQRFPEKTAELKAGSVR